MSESIKLYWAGERDAEQWQGPVESESAARDEALAEGYTGEIWVAPIDPDTDDDEKFWAAVADSFLSGTESVDEQLAEGGWVDFEDSWLPSIVNDRDGILAAALRQALPERPSWRTVDTLNARKVSL